VCSTLVIVDVLSFTTAVDVAVARGASVQPWAILDERAAEAARASGAVLGVSRRHVTAEQPYSLSPPTLAKIPSGTRLLLPSPNGAMLTVLASSFGGLVIAGCLRNASAVAAQLRASRLPLGVIAAGERWADGSLRPAIEDLIGAGAIIGQLDGARPSPEAEIAAAAFNHARQRLDAVLSDSVSGRELIELGYADDVRMAVELDVSGAVPLLVDGAYELAV
jgi:2-phosphosulfolactate phosphatase